MKKIFLVFLFSTILGLLVKANNCIIDTCVFDFIENNETRNLAQAFDFEKLFLGNKEKDFYIAEITITGGSQKEPKGIIREFSSLGDGKSISFNDAIVSLEYDKIQVDTTVLFKFIGDSKRVSFNAYGCGLSSHSDLKIFILKLYNKQFIGFSYDGSDLISSFLKIVNKYFVFSDEQLKARFFLIFSSLSQQNINKKNNQYF